MFLYYSRIQSCSGSREHVYDSSIHRKPRSIKKKNANVTPSTLLQNHIAIEPTIQAERQQCVKQERLVQEDEIERRVIVSDAECLRRTVHSEQANESVGFVSGVEL